MSDETVSERDRAWQEYLASNYMPISDKDKWVWDIAYAAAWAVAQYTKSQEQPKP